MIGMDKYTVDLDKVLNDFEYSELTEQYVKATPSRSTKNANVKHSINNVFHSLNEYINSDVSDQCNRVSEIPPVATCVVQPEEDEVVKDERTEDALTEPLVAVDTTDEASISNESNEKVEECVDISEEPCPSTDDSLVNEPPLQVDIKTEVIPEPETANESKEIEEERETVIGFKDDIEIDDSTLNRFLDELEDEENDVETNVEEGKVTARPQSLEIPEQASNVIGEPGSTPYTNISVENELSKVDNESDRSLSPSPTFSDSSSGGSTTPSTETVNEDGDQKETAVPNTNVENEDIPVDSLEQSDVSSSCDNAEACVISEQPEEEPKSDDVPVGEVNDEGVARSDSWLGKQAPLWIPDEEALSCLHCDAKFTLIKRRHHCRACGLVLCSKCCNLKHRLEYLDAEARVCTRCHEILSRDTNSSSGSEVSTVSGSSPYRSQPNPNNPMEYCSMVPPLQQVGSSSSAPPSVMVPVGVLKRKGSNKSRTSKSVMFCDGIRPGSDLTNLDNDFNYSTSAASGDGTETSKTHKRNVPVLDSDTKSYIPASEDCLPPTVTFYKSDISYSECGNTSNVVEMLKNEILTFALQRNLYVQVKIINMDCCINKHAWCFSTDGLINVGQDEIVILLELMEDEKTVPKDVFYHINEIYNDAVKGTTVKEFGISLHSTSTFLDSKNHAGFVYVRPTFQCIQKVLLPKEQYLIGILMHRWETPWAKIFPLRLVLRLGAQYRYYPSPIISTRHRESVFVEIGHTIINLLADFRNFSYTLPQIRGLVIHMEDKNTTVLIPSNRYDQVMKSINNSSDHILAFAGNFSSKADSHLVCIQDVHSNSENSYSTHAINIQNKPRKVTGASFIVFNGALKSSSGLTAKSSIVEDGLMIQIPPENMNKIRESLRNMKDYVIHCGCVNAVSDETVNIIWSDPDLNFNVGVVSPIDEKSMTGVPSIRVHNGKDFICNSGNRLLRWTEVFILQNGNECSKTQDTVDISKISESISKGVCQALVKYLDLLASNSFFKIGVRATLHVENVSYSAGSNGLKLPPIYMKSLDNELIPVLHRIASNNFGDNEVVLELIFHVLNL